MACRRADRRNLIGCHIGPVALRGCDYNCCPYLKDTKEDIISNERRCYLLPHSQGSMSEGVPSHRHEQCRNPYRARFVCVGCRRAFKTHLRDECEYRRLGWSNSFEVRLDREWVKEKKSAMRDASRKIVPKKEYLELARLRRKLNDMAESTTGNLWSQLKPLHCPGCGAKGTPVGTTFRAPPKSDHKAWDNVEKMWEGEGREGMAFTYCPIRSEKEEAEMIREARRIVQRRDNEESWREEKARRIRDLRRPSM
ncbi:hypothetical protein OE88DRAFT_1663030 [Heliocybe sulcata]|uniref:Uncharacterized protein n=1 Tax=Heliocybe sulcata TaxID=5364 RepID=A0A5C3N6Q6_9AGAM|nr:hypothetical protein OE88DRAFT_1663030 [Heliocybe sulcata]